MNRWISPLLPQPAACLLPSAVTPLAAISQVATSQVATSQVIRGFAPKKVAVTAGFYWAAALFSLSLLAYLPSAVYAQSDVALPVPEQVVNLGAEAGRQFPPNAVRGKLQVVQGADVLIDGKPERLSPGARIRGPQNTLVMTGAIIGQELVVNFVRDAYGNLHQVWLLTALEAKQKVKRATPENNFFFSSDANKPKVDDGKTPFDQLPKFKQ